MKRFASRVYRGCFALTMLAVLGRSPIARAGEAEVGEASDAPVAAKARAFGEAGTLVLDDLLGLGVATSPGVVVSPIGIGSAQATGVSMTGWIAYGEQSYEASGVTTSLRMSTLALAPSFDVFVARNLSLGSRITVLRSTFRTDLEASALGAGLEPRVGWAVSLTDGLVFWPRAFGSLGVVHAESIPSTHGAPGPTSKLTTVSWGLGVDASLVAPLGRLVALTFGPTLEYSKTDAVKSDSRRPPRVR